MKALVIFLIITLMVLHQDFWWWDSYETVFDFMPVGLAYHLFISIAAAAVWLLAVKFCWPNELDREEAQSDDATEGRSDR
jgi:hypothetical protein